MEIMIERLNSKEIDKIPHDSGIYKIINITNNKIYIGSAFNLHNRIYNHCFLLRKNEHHNPHLQFAWNKYKEESFEFSVIEICEKDNLLIREQFWLDKYKSYDNKYGYNICKIAGNTSGRCFSEETKQKIRESRLGSKVSEEAKIKMSKSRTGEKNGMYGKNHTEEAKKKMSKNRKDTSGNKNHFYGKHHSEETKEKLRKIATEKKLRPNAILSEKDVFEIKCKILQKPKDMMWKDFNKEVAQKYNVSEKTINDIRTGRRWGSFKMITYVDKTNRFVEMFNPDNGFYVRSGIIDENGKDTGVDPFMRNYPSLIDVGIMNKCVCAHKCNVDCYQKAIDRTGSNMSLENYKQILEECKGKVFQFALGGAGDVDTHENFEDIIKLSREYGIVPNFTTSGILMTKEKAELCKKYCGSIAVSEHFADYTERALDLLLEAGIKTNIHYVLSNKSIDVAIERLKNNSFKKGINAVIFLLYKPVGLGKKENVLKVDDPRVKEFFELIDTCHVDFKIGFDSCTVPGLVNFTKNINPDSFDTCEGGRHSMYITSDMKALPCSFDNQELKWAYDISNDTIQNAWNSDQFEDFRSHFKNSCGGCSRRNECMGGCPIRREIVLCNREEKDLYESTQRLCN